MSLARIALFPRRLSLGHLNDSSLDSENILLRPELTSERTAGLLPKKRSIVSQNVVTDDSGLSCSRVVLGTSIRSRFRSESSEGIYGRTVDVHCLPHSFATWIGQSGVSPKAAQRLMRHYDVNLTMRYTRATPDAELKALAALPSANLNPEPSVSVFTTGTDALAPLLAPESVGDCTAQSHSGKVRGLRGSASASASARKRPENPVKQGVYGHPSKYTREDSNLQPPVPKTGALSN